MNLLGGFYMKDKQAVQKDKIIQAAMKVLFEQGLNEMTFRNIATEVGMSPGTLYYYYNSKDLILYDILDQNSNKTLELVKETQSNLSNKEEVSAKMMQMMNTYVQNNKQNMIFLHLLHEAVSGNNELVEKINQKYNAWFDSFEDLIELYFGIPKGPLSKAIAIIIDALVDGLTFMDLLGIDTIKRPEIQVVITYLFSEEFGEHIQSFYKKNTSC